MIHKTAIINPGARLGKDVDVGPFTTIEADVTIGEGTVIGPNVSIMPYTSIGSRCHVHAGAVLGGVPACVSEEVARTRPHQGSNPVISRVVLRVGATVRSCRVAARA